jgi:hypothetical protein
MELGRLFNPRNYYYIAGFGIPALIVGITAGFAGDDAYGSEQRYCHFNHMTLQFSF